MRHISSMTTAIYLACCCRCRLTPPERVVEVSGPLVDHASILAHPAGLHALDSILYKLGVPHQSTLTQLVKNVVVP